jgi:hypothetical protein
MIRERITIAHPAIPARGPPRQPPSIALASCKDEAGPTTAHPRDDNDDEDGPGPLNTAGLAGIDPWAEDQKEGPSSEAAKEGGRGASDNGKAHDSDLLLDGGYAQLQSLKYPADSELPAPTYDPIFPPPTLSNDLELLQLFYQSDTPQLRTTTGPAHWLDSIESENTPNSGSTSTQSN